MRRRVLQASAAWADPALAFAALYGDRPGAVWLDTSAPGERDTRSYLGAASRVVTSAASWPLEVRAALAEHGVRPRAGGGFALGWVGWFGYELRAATMGIAVAHPSPHPPFALAFLDRAIEFDERERSVTLLALGDSWSGELARWRDETRDALARARLARAPVPAPMPSAGRTARWRHSDEEYVRMIARCQEHIADGDAYQLCLTTEARVDGPVDDLETYLALRERSPSHHGGLLRIGGVSLVSSSPERFLEVTPSGRVRSSPIKGTARRADDAEEDAALARGLIESAKERAENVMIVDLVRNDLARVCAPGSVAVRRLLAVESYPHVHQLVSEVTGRLRPGLDALDAFAACFPAGSMTGAPKHAATRILEAIEGRARGVYSGAFGYLGLDGRVDLAMVIRSIVVDEHGATVGAGGGITALSDPLAELAEVRLKAAALLAALGVASSAVSRA